MHTILSTHCVLFFCSRMPFQRAANLHCENAKTKILNTGVQYSLYDLLLLTLAIQHRSTLLLHLECQRTTKMHREIAKTKILQLILCMYRQHHVYNILTARATINIVYIYIHNISMYNKLTARASSARGCRTTSTRAPPSVCRCAASSARGTRTRDDAAHRSSLSTGGALQWRSKTAPFEKIVLDSNIVTDSFH